MAPWWYRAHLSAQQVNALRQYKYAGEDRSLMRQYIMNPMYNRLVSFFPLWMAPNMITLSGFLLIVASHLQLLYYSHDLTQQAPRSVYALAGWALFSYMVLDNLDGKQARRTNSSSPLGQLFDHGCDALNVTLSGMTMLATVQLGCTAQAMLMLLTLGHTMLFMATLEEYLTGAMILRQLNGPNEGIMTLCCLYALTAVFGPQLWHKQLSQLVPDSLLTHIPQQVSALAMNRICVIVSIVATIHAVAGNVYGVVQHARGMKQRLKALTNMVARSVPLLLYASIFQLTPILAPRTFANVGIAMMWTSGGAIYDLITRVMLAHLTGGCYPYVPVLLVPCIVSCAAVVGAERGVMQHYSGDVTIVVGAMAIMVTVYNVWRAFCVIAQICETLNVRCFSLKRLREDGATTENADDDSCHHVASKLSEDGDQQTTKKDL
ncbi:putative CDP-alcohol phosphatidyltransferase class-I family protein 3 [Gracilariopsis chorda]|uniref:Putative CDP-alcohol phosphatidyltransferase class-I family protein 3 n=1 Tax=Gracilariopsis chorda TaxID=448386 RepID=A0A2V3IPZ2_9FLOR|nr:putative CDP-alcohol phosphatidyltransferase class-I family protein 3 [Gracilariopsis chorda]|eukprot:PXF44134.1 putative CDP-alcohol phosphatidyltransferase class-I family protein 3 [Gracilariopsis chorda]